jgi:uncharacterized membrane protein YhhN
VSQLHSPDQAPSQDPATAQRTLGVALVSAVLAIAAAPWALALPWLAFVFKPLATLALIAYAWPRGRTTPARRRWVLIGLCLSLVGDVALLWPQQGFLPGLVSFLLAHLAYLCAMTRATPRHALARPAWPFVAYALVAGAVLVYLWPGVPTGLRGPVAGYVVCLAAMAAQAAVVWRQGDARGATLALGGALFVLSDALLAINKFSAPLPMASLWILASYWLAQALIAHWLAPAETSDAH